MKQKNEAVSWKIKWWIVSETSETISNTPTFIGVPEEEKKKKGYDKNW